MLIRHPAVQKYVKRGENDPSLQQERLVKNFSVTLIFDKQNEIVELPVLDKIDVFADDIVGVLAALY